ncbi:MoxR family ATPase [Candidatus Dependentiae bacterium]|nr:MoxR family ATPase [Candidatus Dependentiae bacterium]
MDNNSIARIAQDFRKLSTELSTIIVGNNNVLEQMLIALLCNGHVLLEGLPGVAKTTMIKTLCQTLGLSFKRIQFTPDLLPSDLVGTLVFNPKTVEFETKKGPIFAHIILADEINRAPAKVQSALLECMQEHQVTIGSTTFLLDEPFMVFATQNPLEQEGTYRLPEAQVDRFLFKLLIDYPQAQQEVQIIERSQQELAVHQIMQREELLAAQQAVKKIFVDKAIIEYIVAIVQATRNPAAAGLTKLREYILCGASPRASLALHHAAQGHALLQQRDFVTPDDVKKIAHPVLRHRIIPHYQASLDMISNDEIINTILATIPTP